MGAVIPAGIDGRATFHHEDLIGEHIRCHLQQQAHGIGIGLIHGA